MLYSGGYGIYYIFTKKKLSIHDSIFSTNNYLKQINDFIIAKLVVNNYYTVSVVLLLTVLYEKSSKYWHFFL